ncbi:MAG: hydrolase, partial [Acidobacteria bacterium]|nr:hydrolase [Acidobacteriota bacterium]
LAFDPNAPAWGINFQRTVRRKNEELLWTGHQRNQGLRRMATAGLLVGLTDIAQGRGWELKPYSAGYLADAPGRTPSVARHGSANVGGDVSYNFTPSLRGVASFNTDFAETEVDQRLVNLTRFPLFLPERRTFFLDGATFFDFANRAFFSRRIGLDARGQPQRVDIGTKVIGQAGRQDIGALYVRTGEDGPSLGEDFLVLRTRRRILEQSYVGALYTGRATRGQSAPGTRHTIGLDARLATRSFIGSKNLEASAFWMQATNSDSLGDSRAFGGWLWYPNDIWEGGGGFQQVGARFDPAVGFTPRRGFRHYNPTVFYMRRPAARHPKVRRYGWGVATDLFTDLNNEWVTREIDVRLGRVEFHSGDNIELNVTPSYERLQRDFAISSSVTLPAGREYSFTRYQASLSTANQRVVALRPSIEWGGFFSGDRTEYSLGVDVRPRPGVRVNTTYEYNRVTLPEGRFDTRLIRVVADTQFSPFMYLVNNVQYDSVSRGLGWQSRYRWIVRPGNDVFLVYTHNWVDDHLDPNQRFRTLDRRGAAKVVYTKRF